ncbi:helix-turn-helix domain-containing protein [Streptomyces chartreusis]
MYQPTTPDPVLDEQSLTALRAPAVRRLLALRAEKRLTREHVSVAGECLGVSERTVWRWLADASRDPATAARPGARRGDRFEITPPVRVLLAYWRGNASMAHRQLAAHAASAATGEDATPACPCPRRHAQRPGTAAGPDALPVDVPARRTPRPHRRRMGRPRSRPGRRPRPRRVRRPPRPLAQPHLGNRPRPGPLQLGF